MSSDSTPTLLSDEESEDVSGSNMLSLPGDKTPEEARLERKGGFRPLQVFRYNLYRKEINTESRYDDALCDILYYEDELRKNCQKEIVLRQKKKKEEADTRSKRRTSSFEDEISKLYQDNWLKTRGWWWTRGLIMGAYGPLGRAFNLWRSNNLWYMHPVLVDDCKTRGGCCDRDCGCCRDDQRANSSVGVLGAGHCTLECGCCLESSNSEPNTSEAKNYYAARFTFDNSSKTINLQLDPYRHRLCLAAIWGVEPE